MKLVKATLEIQFFFFKCDFFDLDSDNSMICFANFLQECRKKLEVSLEESNGKLQDALFSKEKLARNFDETEKLYVEKIQTLQEEVTVTKSQIEETQEKFVLYSNPCIQKIIGNPVIIYDCLTKKIFYY